MMSNYRFPGNRQKEEAIWLLESISRPRESLFNDAIRALWDSVEAGYLTNDEAEKLLQYIVSLYIEQELSATIYNYLGSWRQGRRERLLGLVAH